MSNTLINIDGQVYDAEMAKVSATDRSFLFGDSVYETTIAKDKTTLFLDEHIERLYHSAELIKMKISQSPEIILRRIKETLAASNFDQSILRIVVSRGGNEVNLKPEPNLPTNLYIYLKKLNPYPTTWYQDGVDFIIAKTIRNHRLSLNPMAKTGNYLNSLLALMEAQEANAHDALMVNHDGFISEGTTNNFFIVKNGIIKTPSLDCGLLHGITRDKIIFLCKKNNIKLEETHITVSDLANIDEAFYSSSTKGAVPVTIIDKIKVGSGKVGVLTKKIHQAYEDFALKSYK